MLRSFPVLASLFVWMSSVSILSAQEAKEPLLPADQSIEQAIDHYVEASLHEEQLTPAPPADDAEWLRRVTLDLDGRIPTVAEMHDYLTSTAADKKVQVVDRLLASGGFVRHQARELAILMQVQDGRKATQGPLQDYLRNALTENRGWDRIFRELMLPDESDPKQQGAGEFLKARVKDIDRLTIDVSTVFFGVNVSCAQCHDHPHVPAWTQDHFYGLKSFFARSVDVGGFVGEKDFGSVKYVPNKKPEKVAPVMFLTGKPLDVPGLAEPTKEEKQKEQDRLETAKKNKKAPAPPQFSLRAKLVETALQPGEDTFFSRAIVNRLFYRFLGRGLVMPLDQMHLENPASHPELLQWLARDLVEHQYDLRRLVRGIVLSNTYGRASRWEGANVPAAKWFAVAQVRPLTAMQMALSLKLATLDPKPPADAKEQEKRLDELAKNAERLAGQFAEPGTNFQVGVSEAMLFANNESLTKELLQVPDTLVAHMMTEPDFARRAAMAVEAVLSRPAKPDEIQVMVNYMQRRPDRPEAGCQQVVWALLTSAEFRFNH